MAYWHTADGTRSARLIMPIYEHRCRDCGLRFISSSRDPEEECNNCQSRNTHRLFSFNPITSFQPHYSTALGRYVSTRQDFMDGLARASEHATAVTGIEHNYRPIDWQDREAFGATEEGMDSYYRVDHPESYQEVV